MNISKDWLPTPENINDLPAPVKKYIHDIETLCDPQYLIQELILTKDLNRTLELNYTELLKRKIHEHLQS